jgi:predicted NBD/HSP70 family sugar kinase
MPPPAPKNIQAILELLLHHPGATRPQLCQLSGLTPSAMHGVMTLLQGTGMIEFTGNYASTGGRRAGHYRLRPDLGAVIGVSLRMDQLDAGLFDMGLTPLAEVSRPVSLADMGPESYTLMIAEVVLELLARTRPENCFGVGVTVPGPVLFPSGVVRQLSGAPLWEDFPLAKRLSTALDLPVTADKDVYAGVEYLHFSGKVHHPGCAAYLSICDGIGTALMLEGKAFRGSHSLSGEIGHLTVRKDGIPCRCGNVGCLELYCSDIGLVRQYNTQSGSTCQHVEEILRKLETGDSLAAKVVAQAIGYLVDTTSSIIMSYDPQELIIYCRWLNRQKALYFKMLDVLYAKSVFTRKHQVDIRLLPADSIYLPAAALIAALRFVRESRFAL